MLENPFKNDHQGEEFIPTASLEIYKYIERELTRSEDTHVARASAASMCVKRRQLQRLGVKGTPLTPRKIINFTLGDLTERVLLYFISRALVGEGRLYSRISLGDEIGSCSVQGKLIPIHKQKDLSFTHPSGFKVTGHADGFGRRNVDGKWEIIEIKSAADYGFKSFIDEGAGDYLKQSHALFEMDAVKELGISDVRFYFLRKSTGHLWDRLHSRDPLITDLVLKEFDIAQRDDYIEPPFKLVDETYRKVPTGRKVAAWQCSYCSFTQACQGKFEVEFKKDQFGYRKPILVFKGES